MFEVMVRQRVFVTVIW